MNQKSKTNGQTETVETKKPELSILGVASQKPLSIEQKLEKLSSLVHLKEKREKLFSSAQKLDSFILGSEDEISTFKITDKEGNTFLTGNPLVINKVVELVKAELKTQLQKVEAEIEF